MVLNPANTKGGKQFGSGLVKRVCRRVPCMCGWMAMDGWMEGGREGGREGRMDGWRAMNGWMR